MFNTQKTVCLLGQGSLHGGTDGGIAVASEKLQRIEPKLNNCANAM
jgi:hypothetical protein